MRDSRSTVGSQDGTNTTPAADLADVWDVLDTLPSAKPAADLTATTIELVAAKVANDVRPAAAAKPRWIDRLVPLAIILGGLVVGLVAGRWSAPDPDARILERLPVIEHLGLLQELGSVEFLEALAAQMAGGEKNAPRWLRFMRDPASLRADAQEFEAALGALRSEVSTKEAPGDAIERRRERVRDLSPSELSALEKTAATFEGLTAVDRRELERLAAVLADPARAPLHEAAKQWHIIVTAINPAFRRNIVEMPSDERLEWLARSAGRDEPRGPSRPREDERGGEWRPPGPRRDGPDDRPRPGTWKPLPFQGPPMNGAPSGPPPPQAERPPVKSPAASRPFPPREDASEIRERPR